MIYLPATSEATSKRNHPNGLRELVNAPNWCEYPSLTILFVSRCNGFWRFERGFVGSRWKAVLTKLNFFFNIFTSVATLQKMHEAFDVKCYGGETKAHFETSTVGE